MTLSQSIKIPDLEIPLGDWDPEQCPLLNLSPAK